MFVLFALSACPNQKPLSCIYHLYYLITLLSHHSWRLPPSPLQFPAAPDLSMPKLFPSEDAHLPSHPSLALPILDVFELRVPPFCSSS